jgi:hypothetical protein
VVSLTLRPLYLRNPLVRRLGGPQSRFIRYIEVKILAPTRIRTPCPLVLQPVASRYSDCAFPALIINNSNYSNIGDDSSSSSGSSCGRSSNSSRSSRRITIAIGMPNLEAYHYKHGGLLLSNSRVRFLPNIWNLKYH